MIDKDLVGIVNKMSGLMQKNINFFNQNIDSIEDKEKRDFLKMAMVKAQKGEITMDELLEQVKKWQ